jgi:hypothetical protein
MPCRERDDLGRTLQRIGRQVAPRSGTQAVEEHQLGEAGL